MWLRHSMEPQPHAKLYGFEHSKLTSAYIGKDPPGSRMHVRSQSHVTNRFDHLLKMTLLHFSRVMKQVASAPDCCTRRSVGSVHSAGRWSTEGQSTTSASGPGVPASITSPGCTVRPAAVVTACPRCSCPKAGPGATPRAFACRVHDNHSNRLSTGFNVHSFAPGPDKLDAHSAYPQHKVS